MSARPSAAELADYLKEHTNPEAAEHYGVNLRTIHKWKARPDVPVEAPQMAQDEPHESFATIRASAIADGDCMWKCPHCGDLHHPLPGTTGATWSKNGCYLCSTRHNAPGTPALAVEAPCPAVQPMSTEVPEMAIEDDITDTSVTISLPMPVPDQGIVPVQNSAVQSEMPVPVRVVTRVVRVPIERERSSVLIWASAHLPPVQIMVAVLIALALVGATWIR